MTSVCYLRKQNGCQSNLQIMGSVQKILSQTRLNSTKFPHNESYRGEWRKTIIKEYDYETGMTNKEYKGLPVRFL